MFNRARAMKRYRTMRAATPAIRLVRVPNVAPKHWRQPPASPVSSARAARRRKEGHDERHAQRMVAATHVRDGAHALRRGASRDHDLGGAWWPARSRCDLAP